MLTIHVVYFAWVRERIGIPSETVVFDGETVSDLVVYLRARGERYSLAFKDPSVIRAATDQELCDFDKSISGVSEVAFFPPMTGG